MRILIVDTCYGAFLDAHYARNLELESRPYAEQWRALMDTFFGTADSYSHHLRALGHEAQEVVANCAPMQEAWMREHGMAPLRRAYRPRVLQRLARAARSAASSRWPRRLYALRSRFPTLAGAGSGASSREEQIVLAQATEFRPDVVYVQNLSYLSSPTIGRLRQMSGLVVGQIAIEPPPAAKLRAFDLILTSFPHYVERFRRLGVASEYFRIGFDPRVLDRLAVEQREQHGAVFVGDLNRARHRVGNTVIERAARRVPIDFWGYGGDGWPADSPMTTRYRGEAWGLEMLRLLHGSRIALNRHIETAADYANNMRLYEATGVGTLLITDAKRNLRELFEPDREVVTYADEDELVEKVRFYLDHDEERRDIARAGQARTLRDHSYARRMEELVSIMCARR